MIMGFSVRNFVISLSDENVKRREHIRDQFRSRKVEFSFFDAVTPDKNTAYLREYDLEKAQTTLSPVEISCFLSHYRLWRKIVDEEIQFAGIFEDDIYLGVDASQFIMSSDWIPKNLHILKLEKGIQKKIRTSLKAIETYNTRSIFTLKSAYYGAAGYIISNEGAKFLLKKYEMLDNLLPVDVYLFRVLLSETTYKVGQLIPALCVQDFILYNSAHFQSSLEGLRLQKYGEQPKKNRNFLTKIKIEFTRPFKQIWTLLSKPFFKSVDFR